jgi:hypothetical protein
MTRQWTKRARLFPARGQAQQARDFARKPLPGQQTFAGAANLCWGSKPSLGSEPLLELPAMGSKDRCGALDWKQLLQAANAVDLLKGTVLEHAGKKFGFWMYQLPGLFADSVADYRSVCDVINQAMRSTEGALLGRGAASTAEARGTEYYTWQAVANQCRCKYGYAGTGGHTVFQWDRPGDERPMNLAMLRLRQEHMRLFGIKDAAMFPDCIVANLYTDPSNHIGEHTDSDPLFVGPLALRTCLT